MTEKNRADGSIDNKSGGENRTRKIKQVYLEEDGSSRKVVAKEIKSEEQATEEAINKQTLKEIEESENLELAQRWDYRFDDDDTQIFDPVVHKNKLSNQDIRMMAREEHHKKQRALRMVAVASVLVISIVMAFSMGVFLALWDSGKSISDLQRAIMSREVVARDDVSKQPVKEAYVEEAEVANLQEDSSMLDGNEATEEAVDEVEIIEEAEAVDESDSELEDEEPDPEDAQVEDDDLEDRDIEEVDIDVADEEDDSIEIARSLSGIDSYVKAGSEDELVSLGDGSVAPTTYIDPNVDYPLSFTTVDESYFSDALFIGDSRMQGFGMWSGLPATFYTASGFQLYKYETTKVVQTEEGKVPIFEALPYDAFTKIYIKVGLNEMGWGSEAQFENLYAEFIARLREMEPRAVIYIHGLLPVTAAKSAEGDSHNNTNIAQRNAALAEFAITQNAYFVNAGEAVAGVDGALPAEMTSDGIHMKSQYMPIWKQYIMEHAVVVR